jgi:hypothetical protein
VKKTAQQKPTDTSPQICKSCQHPFTGKVCNMCGEKIFSENQLSGKHFFHEVLDFFYHWESKVLKTIKLNFLRPGFITKENINGIREPYAKPIQLYLVVAFAFIIIISKVGVTDYIPSENDHHYYYLSAHKMFGWAAPIDEWAVNSIDSIWVKKGRLIQKALEEENTEYFVKDNQFVLLGRGNKDSLVLSTDKVPLISFRQMTEVRSKMFHASVGTFSKTLIFILLPVFASFFFLLFFKKIKYYGSSLILATHFMVYNLCVYSLNAVISIAPGYISPKMQGWLLKPFDWLLYNPYLRPFSEFVFGGEFEFFHLLFWMPWFFIAFKRLFNTVWWKNLLISYLCSRIFFYLIFGVLKKILIAFTIWTMHA